MKKQIIFIAVQFFLNSNSYSQTNKIPEIGKPIDNFTIRNISNYPKQTISLNELKGKNIILDFWNKHCSACIASFPKMGQLQKFFKDDVTIFMIGEEDKEGRIRNIYSVAQRIYNLDLVYSFDSIVYKDIVWYGAPHLVWIDKNGIVQAVTNIATEEDVRSFVNGKKFLFKDYSYAARPNPSKYKRAMPLFTDGNGGGDTEFMFRSLLTKYNPEMPFASIYESVKRGVQNEGWMQGVANLKDLYKLAYAGSTEWRMPDSLYTLFYPKIMLDLKDTIEFAADIADGKGFYWYSLIMPPEKTTVNSVMKAMQRDLKTYFGYDVSIETRIMPYWKITATEKAKQELRSKNTDQSSDYAGQDGVKFTNRSMSFLVWNLFVKHIYEKPPIVDKTGITDNIDIELRNVVIINWDDLRLALKGKGLELEKDEMPMKVIVIRDPKMEAN